MKALSQRAVSLGKAGFTLVRTRAERLAAPLSCRRCGEALDQLERHITQGLCFDCEVIAVSQRCYYEHSYGVSSMVSR